jgi:Na+-transporting methylmalonyl-CoA/oxaloacetate decarboxylase gamma subunit
MMPENIQLALQITLVGMGLVFAAILVLWGLMAILVRLAPERRRDDKTETTASGDEFERKRRAAAIAVVIALAQQADTTEPHEFPLPPTAIVSAWQAVMRTRMLNKRGPTRRGPTQ